MFDSETARRYEEDYRQERWDGAYGRSDRGSSRREDYRDARWDGDYRDSRRREFANAYQEEHRDDYRGDFRGMRRDDAYRDVRRNFYEYDTPRRERADYDREEERRSAEDYGRREEGGFRENDGYDRPERNAGDAADKELREAGSAPEMDDPAVSRDMRAGYRSERRERDTRERDLYEDSFQVQMDSFRDKTRQLQEIINDKQDRVDYLERTLADMDDKNRQLQSELDRSRQETGGYAADIEEQVNRLSEILGKDMDGLEQRISDRISELPAQMPGEMQEITIDTDALNESLDNQAKRMEDIFTSISEKLEVIIDRQREAAGQSFDEVFSDQKSFLSNSMLTQEKKLAESFNSVSRQLDGMKDEISEKIHSEDVKVYRNLQDFIQEQDHSEEDQKKLTKMYKGLKAREIFILILTVVDIVLGVFFLAVIM